MKTTTNYGLKKPDGTDLVNVDDLNANADIIDTQLAAKEGLIKNAAAKTSLVDADTLPLSDSAASSATKKVTFANLKVVLKAYFDTLYNNYVHPTYTAKATGLYKVTVDGTGHVSAAAAATKADITALGIPGTNTTYNVATASADGLLSAEDKQKIDGFATELTKVNSQLSVVLGPWSASRNYSKNQLAMADGVIYKSLVDGNTNHVVTDVDWWVAYGGSGPNEYEQLVNYTMLYDCTLGNAQRNQMIDITGGYAAAYRQSGQTCNFNNDGIYLQTSGGSVAMGSYIIAFTKLAIPLERYALAFARFGSWKNGYKLLICACPQLMSDGIVANIDDALLGKSLQTGSGNGNSAFVNLRNITEAHKIGVMLHSTGGTPYANIRHMCLVTDDNWISLCALADISPPASLEMLLNSTASLSLIFNCFDATNFLLKQCTGTVMYGIFTSDAAWECVPTSLKIRMATNEHWNKFATIFNRPLI